MNKNCKYFLNKSQSYDNFEGEKRKLSPINKNKKIKLPPIQKRTSSCGINLEKNPRGQNKYCNFEILNKSFNKSSNKKGLIDFKKFKITNNNKNLGKTQSIFNFSNPLSSLLNVKNNSNKIISNNNDITNKESDLKIKTIRPRYGNEEEGQNKKQIDYQQKYLYSQKQLEKKEKEISELKGEISKLEKQKILLNNMINKENKEDMKQKNIINQRRNDFNQNEEDEKMIQFYEENENNNYFNNNEDIKMI